MTPAGGANGSDVGEPDAVESDDADANATESDDGDDVPAWKAYGYPRKPEWAPDCPRCGGPILGVTVAGPGVSQVTPCGCRVPPSVIEIL
ncbi:hypothetical protein [Halovivax cerinus]|uniref:Uncharacterized protein n=1 Tax=Halovivax cerinus TaxID=1487865 RepID=A0ABD5NQN8_9EURY|nr:hypothetical protein [Halovivax cerinus]